jgi:hypothetical protein
MVSPVSLRPHPAPSTRTAPGDATPPGKSAESPGHKAKAAIAAATLTDLPGTIQGKVASLIARGLDYSSLLTAQPPPPPPPDPTVNPPDTPSDPGSERPAPA